MTMTMMKIIVILNMMNLINTTLILRKHKGNTNGYYYTS